MTAKRLGAVLIGEISRRYSIHPQTLRMYEREGLLRPDRTEGNTRLYSQETIERLEIILTLTRDLGVNLAGVEVILNMKERLESLQKHADRLIDYLKHEAERNTHPNRFALMRVARPDTRK
jgi:MerR family transcriptional regulator/heat shock protein HspR